MCTSPDSEFTKTLITHISNLLNSQTAPETPEELSGIPELEKLGKHIVALRDVLQSFSEGDLEHTIAIRGYAAGCLKALQAHLRHLVWQVEQVANGDFTQRVEFLGEFSASFNSMVIQLDTGLQELRQSEEALSKLTESLQQEAELRKIAMKALEKREAKYKHLAEYDPLTNCMNRRSFFANAAEILGNAAVRNTPCCIAMMDIDHFKRLNDEYGHAIGDEMLKHVTSVAKKQLRDSDIIARFGGEEFLFLFHGTNIENGTHAAQRINTAIAASSYHDSETNQDISCTVSIGVCVVLPHCTAIRDEDFILKAINIADVAMYNSKNTGRNRVTAADPQCLCGDASCLGETHDCATDHH